MTKLYSLQALTTHETYCLQHIICTDAKSCFTKLSKTSPIKHLSILALQLKSSIFIASIMIKYYE